MHVQSRRWLLQGQVKSATSDKALQGIEGLVISRQLLCFVTIARRSSPCRWTWRQAGLWNARPL